jgi:protein phosphatase 1 regulatory subunit 37
MCREILNSCVRNTEEAERLSKTSEGSSILSGRGQRKGVWGMIEESELAKSIRKGEEKRVCFNIRVYSFQITYLFSLVA